VEGGTIPDGDLPYNKDGVLIIPFRG